jgi:hypothetical protein
MVEVRSSLDTLIARFGEQIDGLVPFLALGHESIYTALSPEMTPWYEPEEHSIFDNLELHQAQVAHAAFLLGYSYFEAFVSDLIWLLYRHKPTYLPPEEKLAYEAVLSAESFEEVLERMIDHTTSHMNSLQKKLEHLEKRFGIGKSSPSLLQDANVVRNALVHNFGRVNRVPKGHVRWNVGEAIVLDCKESYEFLLSFKGFGATLFESVETLLSVHRDDSRVC